MGKLNDDYKELTEARYRAQQIKREAEGEVTRLEGLVADAKRYGYKTLDKRQQELDAANDELAIATPMCAEAERVYMEVDRKLDQLQRARNAARLDALLARFFTDQPDARMTVDQGWRRGYTTYEIKLMEMESDGVTVKTETYTDRDGQTQTVGKARFGFHATVYGPHRETTWGVTGELPIIEWATVNWGTLGSLGVDDANQMLRVHGLSVQVAAYLNSQAEAWLSEDEAD